MPLTMPATPSFKSSKFGLDFNTDAFQNTLTRQMQAVERAGARWRASYTLPPMNRAQMAQWQAFLTSLKGQAGSFYGFDPDATTPRGSNIQVPTRTNNVTHSTTFTNAAWNGYYKKPTLTTGLPAPDGSNTASSWNDSTTTGNGGTYGGLFMNGGTNRQQRTVSAWLKASSALGGIRFGVGDGAWTVISLTTSWQRYVFTGNVISDGRIFQIFELANTGTDIFIWGAQSELAATVGPYIPTNGAAATRPAGVSVYGAGQTGSALKVRGFDMLLINALMAGDYVGVAGKMYMLTANASTDVEGACTLSISPAITTAPADGAAVTTSNVTCEMRLVDEGQASWQTNANGICSGMSFSAIEAL